MASNLKAIFKPTNKDIRKKIYFTILLLTIFKIGTTIRVPNTPEIGDLGFLELLNLMNGGALANFSIFALGVMPFITASIIITLAQKDVIPYLKELSKQGQVGRQKLAQITRYLGILFAFVQGYMMATAFIGDEVTRLDRLEVAFILTAGTAFLIWLGDRVTFKGIGNGISMIIMAGIISSLPTMLSTVYTYLMDTSSVQAMALSIVQVALFILLYFGIVVGVVFMERAQRRVPIQHSNKTSAAYSKSNAHLPFKINSASVMPVILASMIMAVPMVIAQFADSERVNYIVSNYFMYTTLVGFLIYMVLIIFFAFFWTFMMQNPKELSKNLSKNASFIPGVRPGADTKKFIIDVLAHLTFIGAMFLVILSAIPIFFNTITGLPENVILGGTGLLIVVGVALETYRQLESSLVSRNYQGGTRRRRNR